MKTIGYVLTEFPVLSETFVGTEMRAMEKHGHKIVPFAFFNNPSNGQPKDQSLAEMVTTLESISNRLALIWLAYFGLLHPSKVFSALAFVRQQRGLSKKSLLIQGVKLAVLARRYHCQHLHAHFALTATSTAIVAGKLLDIPSSFVGHGYDIYATPWDLPLKLGNASFSIAVCEHMRRTFQSLNAKTTTKVVACGIYLPDYPFTPKVHHNGRLVFIGRLTEKKGLATLLQAIARMPITCRPSIDIVGDGPQRSELATLAMELSLTNKISFLGAKNSQWIAQRSSQYLALVAPFCEAANGDRDTGPLVVKEAMAVGLPVITTRFMGCIEIVSGNTGLLVEPRKIDALACAIQRMQNLPIEERLSMQRAARYRIEHQYDCNITTQHLSNAVESAQLCPAH